MFLFLCRFALIILICLNIQGWVDSELDTTAFRCADGQFIFQRWFCDGASDCSDGSDETYGCDSGRCGRNFTCENLQCRHASLRCNENDDCGDGSDEKYCDHQVNITNNCNINAGKFLCKDQKRCLDITHLCDQIAHCLDGSDENELCLISGDGECDEDCTHPCFRTPDGPQCFCRIGETAETNPFCNEMKECTNDFFCDQKCTELGGVQQCLCAENYRLHYGYNCIHNVSGDNILLYSTSRTIRIVSLRKVNESSTYHTLGSYDISTVAGAGEYIYWVVTYPSNGQSLYKGNLNGSTDLKPLISANLGNVTDISVDWITGNIYFTDIMYNYIIVCTPGATLCAQLHRGRLDRPRTLAVSPKSGLLFWGADGSNPYVGRSNMDGTSLTKLVTDGVRSVWSMELYEPIERLYWLDHDRRIVVSIKFDGTDKTIALSEPRYPLMDISAFDGVLFWSFASNITIFNSTYRVSVPLYKDIDNKTIYHIQTYNPLLQTTKRGNPCSKKPCDSGICVLTRVPPPQKKVTYSCLCMTNSTRVTSSGFLCFESDPSVFSDTSGEETETNGESSSHSKRLVYILLLLVLIAVIVFSVNKRSQIRMLHFFSMK